MAVSTNRIFIAAVVGAVLMVGDMIFYTSHIEPFWSESMIIGLVGYMIVFVAISVRSFFT